jgi:hypothetical protein
MARDKVHDEAWLREALQQAGVHEIVYVTPNYYDGGYELRVGTQEMFVEYGVIDAQETAWIERLKS